jgi:hypothetical protein
MKPEDLEVLTVYHFNSNYKIRLGSKFDGGYVIGLLPGNYDCYISAGVFNEESFSRDFIKKYKMDKYNSYAFDGTIDNYPWEFTKNITFIKKNIDYYCDDKHANLSHLISKYSDIFLKMDIEGGEFPWLLSLTEDDLNSFKQIVIEVHGINDDSFGSNYNDKIICLNKLSQTHYLIHAHGNNHGKLIDNIPNVIELTYIRKNTYSNPLKLNQNNLPDKSLDYVCDYLNPSNPEVDLNFPPFVNL